MNETPRKPAIPPHPLVARGDGVIAIVMTLLVLRLGSLVSLTPSLLLSGTVVPTSIVMFGRGDVDLIWRSRHDVAPTAATRRRAPS